MVEVPLDYDSENPNGFEVDNLYREYNLAVTFLANCQSI